MGHQISGIITSFKYEGPLPYIVLVGNFCLIPVEAKRGTSYSEKTLAPYRELTTDTRKLLKDLSFLGKCVYLETNYFGGNGYQQAEAWHEGNRITNPLISFDGMSDANAPAEAVITEDAINEALRTIGVFRHDDKDEFDSMRLGWYRSNRDILNEFKQLQLKNND